MTLVTDDGEHIRVAGAGELTAALAGPFAPSRGNTTEGTKATSAEGSVPP
jgi:hypothetical protein